MSFFFIWTTGFLVILGLMVLLWLLSVYLRDASIVDPFWGTGFVILAWVYFSQTSAGDDSRRLLITTLATIWGLRLSIYLLWRNWGKGEDERYQNFRQRYGRERYWWFSFFQVFLLQGVLMLLVSSPLLGAQIRGGALNWLDGLATAVFLIGFTFEAGGDYQLARFKANSANKGRLLTSGFWRYTRHPNYFGDSAVWWSFGLFSLAAGSFWPALGVVLMTILIIRVSGVALLEKNLKKNKPGYEAYVASTNAFFPWFPKR
jgi:steroid 5-alpha reductase family enzyme